MQNPKPSCIVLGGGGFIGLNLCRRLIASGHRVRAFGRRCLFPQELQGAEWYQGDFTDPTALVAAMETFDVAFHLVHSSTPQGTNLDIAGDVRQNVLSSLAFLDISRQLGISRIVFVSSGGTIYGRPEHVPTPEADPTNPITAYGIGKLSIEKYLALYEHLYHLDYRVLRVTNPYGPFQTTLKNQGIIAALIARALRGERVEIWGDGSVVRDFIYVDDLVDALVAAAEDRSAGRIFNIGSGVGRSLLEVIAATEKLLGTKLNIHWKQARPQDVPISIVAIDRAKAMLGWAPKTTFEAGLEETIKWWSARSQNVQSL